MTNADRGCIRQHQPFACSVDVHEHFVSGGALDLGLYVAHCGGPAQLHVKAGYAIAEPNMKLRAVLRLGKSEFRYGWVIFCSDVERQSLHGRVGGQQNEPVEIQLGAHPAGQFFLQRQGVVDVGTEILQTFVS